MNSLEFGNVIDELCPRSLAEEWDNCGFQICFGDRQVKKVLVALEVTDTVIDEALNNGTDLIVTHHPLLFRNIKNVYDNDVIGNHLIRLIQEEISVFSCHTDFDKMDGGNGDYFGEILGMKNISRIQNDVSGFCRKGELPCEMTVSELKKHIADSVELDEKHIRTAGKTEGRIFKCAWCTGAGSEFADIAFEDGCQCFITGDLKYHEVQEASFLNRIFIDAGHYGTEKIFVPDMAALLRENTDGIEIIESVKDINPFTMI